MTTEWQTKKQIKKKKKKWNMATMIQVKFLFYERVYFDCCSIWNLLNFSTYYTIFISTTLDSIQFQLCIDKFLFSNFDSNFALTTRERNNFFFFFFLLYIFFLLFVVVTKKKFSFTLTELFFPSANQYNKFRLCTAATAAAT